MSDSHVSTLPAARHHHDPALLEQFDTIEQQKDVSQLGMWVFLITEIMFFGGLFAAYLIYRNLYNPAFVFASKSIAISYGAINTAVLICSSLTMAMAVHSAALGARKLLILFLVATLALGGVFLGIKAVEYHDKYVEHHIPGPNFDFNYERAENHEEMAPADVAAQTSIFFALYFAMTGMHALHMIIGVGILLVLIWRAHHGAYPPHHYTMVENFGLYWHFVDIIWIFLFPLLYLVSRSPVH
ncbi:MAG TPA: cytochrome c oxidase subunit 3 family protein [Terriglobales bacterium]|nr:cytochrome c oxidase subunit 3 family protein [Terriglobales bacterium]